MADSRIPVAGTLPVLPLRAQEYATLSRRDARGLFRASPPLCAAWSMVYVIDAAEARWTVLGDPQYLAAARAAERPAPRDVVAAIAPSPLPTTPPPSGMMLDVAEFPLDELRPSWVLAGWPDDWPGMVRAGVALAAYSWPVVR